MENNKNKKSINRSNHPSIRVQSNCFEKRSVRDVERGDENENKTKKIPEEQNKSQDRIVSTVAVPSLIRLHVLCRQSIRRRRRRGIACWRPWLTHTTAHYL